jgi:hypothetical protein
MAKTITVKKGDTLSQILKDAGVSSYGSRSTWNTVAKASGIADPNKIWKGNKVVIPDSLLGKTSSSSTTSAPAPTSAPTPSPETSAELADYLNKQQEQLMELEDYDPFDGDIEGSIDEAIDAITGGQEMPEAPKYMEMFEKMREEHGLDTLEQGLNQYKDLIRQEQNLLRQQRNDIRGGQTRMGVIEGRVDQATRDRMEMIDDYQRQAQFLADGINSAYSWIQLQMDITQLDYETTKEQYDSEFKKRLTMYETLTQEAREERDWKYQLIKDAEARATTHLTMFMDLISSGQTTWDNLSTTQKTEIHKMEVQAGLPMGFMSSVKMEANANVMSATQRTDPSGKTYVDIVYKDPATGEVKVRNEYVGRSKVASSGGSTTSRNSYGYTSSQWRSKVAEARSELAKLEKQYEKDIYESGGTTGSGTYKGDQVLADWEIKKANKEFNAKYGEAGTELLYEALTTGGYKTWDYNNNRVAPLSILGI